VVYESNYFRSICKRRNLVPATKHRNRLTLRQSNETEQKQNSHFEGVSGHASHWRDLMFCHFGSFLSFFSLGSVANIAGTYFYVNFKCSLACLFFVQYKIELFAANWGCRNTTTYKIKLIQILSFKIDQLKRRPSTLGRPAHAGSSGAVQCCKHKHP
jgi:hypothetical protein